jgi:hypothetical protein
MDVLHDLKKLHLDSNFLNLELSIISIMGSSGLELKELTPQNLYGKELEETCY